jgi:BirA family biotin operon repressor/biotin-[acetyl-CoA-carboxylase] ligase
VSTLVADELRRGLRSRIIGRDIRVYDLVISTNDLLWELADRGAEEGTVVFAEEQTRGRGRLGRSWWSPRGKGLWMSVLLRPPLRESAGRMRAGRLQPS